MKKKALLTAALISALLFSAVAGTQLVSLATANPFFVYNSPPILSIDSPANGAHVNSVLLNLTVTKSEGWLSAPLGGLAQKLIRIKFQVDNKLSWVVTPNSNLSSPFNYAEYLTNLTDGNHILEVYVYATGVWTAYYDETYWSHSELVDSVFATVNFTLDTTPPNISFLSAEKSDETCEFPLNVTVNEPKSQITYSLDGQKNMTTTGNTTLTNLPYGKHNVTVFATDEAGNTGASETVTFTIAAPPEPFPITMVILQ